MPWALNFQQDTEILGVGTATATFTDDEGRTVASHAGRIDSRDGATLDEFIEQSLSRHAKAQARDTETDAVLAKIQLVLNEKTKG